jgi:hypothetical protein
MCKVLALPTPPVRRICTPVTRCSASASVNPLPATEDASITLTAKGLSRTSRAEPTSAVASMPGSSSGAGISASRSSRASPAESEMTSERRP